MVSGKKVSRVVGRGIVQDCADHVNVGPVSFNWGRKRSIEDDLHPGSDHPGSDHPGSDHPGSDHPQYQHIKVGLAIMFLKRLAS